ncbi:MAG TPA: multifunctional oxoglutarate decarboxylase/oxoglutarate dehydrogenase thiamine pyrophosphate-binding subunit/dihydrolipoyllysine-residue succinyltransferase subunit, partial [Terrimesophilobacter sp.]|nr:multifunctional oxoglutarate decarboxylase/oxoglutarate dehydrogenase thiamine pyrophosphate-binding subunit/dihydrolipoyllysine-residue succinyltransferase subunit [Terrimesophilobacter sp.]
PLIVFTPKAMLRLRGATSDVAEFTSGRFQPVIDDATITDAESVKRVLLHSGKIHYDLVAEREKLDVKDIALVRVEQYYPLPLRELIEVLGRYPNAELVWVQEEPENQGAWPFICLELLRVGKRQIDVVSRPASASPATGSSKRSAIEHASILERALTLAE